MKNILKFLAIFVSSILLSLIFGYWFGSFESWISGSKIFGNFPLPLSTDAATVIAGIPYAYILFFGTLTMLIAKAKMTIMFLLIGVLPFLILLFSYRIFEGFLGFSMLVLGLLLGELVLLVKKKFFVSHPRN